MHIYDDADDKIVEKFVVNSDFINMHVKKMKINKEKELILESESASKLTRSEKNKNP